MQLNQEAVAQSSWGRETVAFMQIALFVMCGGGLIGHMAAEQPEDFYIDDRLSKRPYARKDIYQAVATLITLARVNGIDTKKMPEMPRFHNMGVF